MVGNQWMIALTLLGLGVVLKFAGPLACACDWLDSFSSPWCWGPSLGGNVFFFAGCFWAARAKGRSAWWGLSGFLCVLALPILARLADRSRETASADAGPPTRTASGSQRR